MQDFSEQRRRLVAELRSEGISSEAVLAAIGNVPRELFVPEVHGDEAYRNAALPIAEGQTISQPFVVALMTQELELTGTQLVLEVGTGSGYQTAILAQLSLNVVSIERHARLVASARELIASLGFRNAEVHLSDGSLGWLDAAPYDRIIVTAAAPDVPRPLLDQLGPEGRMVIPVGSERQQDLVVVTRQGGKVAQRRIGPVRFVPLVGQAGWQRAD